MSLNIRSLKKYLLSTLVLWTSSWWVAACWVCHSCLVVRALLQPPHTHQPPPPPTQAARTLGHSKVNTRNIFLETSTFKNRKARRFINRAFENVQYFCLTKTSVAQLSIWNTECFSYPSGGVLAGGFQWSWLQGRSAWLPSLLAQRFPSGQPVLP